MPFGGAGESAAIVLFGGFLVFAVSKAVMAIRGGRVAQHREWMIRSFALALAISTVRVVAAVLDLTLTPAGLGPRPAFVISLWVGWITTVGAAELWIRFTRAENPSAR
jgi:uncharacterized membrane protein